MHNSVGITPKVMLTFMSNEIILLEFGFTNPEKPKHLYLIEVGTC